GALAWEGRGKEFRGVAKLLALDAQFVAVLRVQPIPMLATFQGLLPLPTQLLCCLCCAPASPQHTPGVVWVARPIARLDPCCGIESKSAKAQAFYCRPCAQLQPKVLRVGFHQCRTIPIDGALGVSDVPVD